MINISNEFDNLRTEFIRRDAIIKEVAIANNERPPSQVPVPSALIGNFAIVGHEVRKHDLLGEFPNAFRSGAIGGSVLQLSLCKVNSDDLDA